MGYAMLMVSIGTMLFTIQKSTPYIVSISLWRAIGPNACSQYPFLSLRKVILELASCSSRGSLEYGP